LNGLGFAAFEAGTTLVASRCIFPAFETIANVFFPRE
jgi:hypothetical protein